MRSKDYADDDDDDDGDEDDGDEWSADLGIKGIAGVGGDCGRRGIAGVAEGDCGSGRGAIGKRSARSMCVCVCVLYKWVVAFCCLVFCFLNWHGREI